MTQQPLQHHTWHQQRSTAAARLSASPACRCRCRAATPGGNQPQPPPPPQQLPAVWCQGLAQGTLAAEVSQAFPPVTWQPRDLAQVLTRVLPAAAAAVSINSQLPAWLPADAATNHLCQEAVLAVLLTGACRLALGPRVTAAQPSPYWLLQTAGTCVVLFPLADPLLSHAWQPVVQAVLGPAPVNPLVAELQQAGDARDWLAISQHCVASGLLGPLWEEVFFRGFFLAALTKVLPLPACVAVSALTFAALHLSPPNFAPLLVLGAACDLLFLRSGGNLAAPLLLHGAWNTSQVLAIALLHKEAFV